MKSTLTLLLILCTVVLSAQKREIQVDDFSELTFALPGKLYLQQGDTEKVEIDCSDDVFEKLEFENSRGRLIIRNRNRSGWSWNGFRGSDIRVYVTMKDIDRISASGSGSVIGEGTFRTDDLTLSVSGSGSLSLATISDDMMIKVSGSGSMELEGEADDIEVRISGSGRVKAEDLEVKTLDASISGSGSCYITATEEIEASISGSGSVYYNGNPDRVIKHSSGSGKIRRM